MGVGVKISCRVSTWYHLSDGIWGTLYKTKRFKNGISLGFCIIGTSRFGTTELHFAFRKELQVSLGN